MCIYMLVKSRGQLRVSFLTKYHLSFFETGSLPGTWGSQTRLGRLASVPQRSSSAHLPSTENTSE